MRLLSHQAQSNDLQGEQRHRATWSSEQCEVIMLSCTYTQTIFGCVIMVTTEAIKCG